MRGEYNGNRFFPTMTSELPPRTRRIQKHRVAAAAQLGTTSAYAENTLEWEPAFLTTGNYLRVRGEYIITYYNKTLSSELPPRARRILFAVFYINHMGGTTSACAENTDPTLDAKMS